MQRQEVNGAISACLQEAIQPRTTSSRGCDSWPSKPNIRGFQGLNELHPQLRSFVWCHVGLVHIVWLIKGLQELRVSHWKH